jgi:peroxiredoxin
MLTAHKLELKLRSGVRRLENEEIKLATLEIGEKVPNFTLQDTDGHSVEFVAGSGPAVVIFTCNHCPYARAWHERLNDAGRDYTGKGVQFFQINSNDVTKSPHDSLQAMKDRVAAGEFVGPYLRDEGQEVARAFDATRTPEVFVVSADGELAYHGAPDENSDEPKLDAHWVREALDDVLSDRPVKLASTKPVGCTIKWAS